MKAAFMVAAASAVAVNAVATPAKIEARASKSSSGSMPTVTVKGNGESIFDPMDRRMPEESPSADIILFA